MQITGAQLFVKALKEEGVEVLFGYPGGQAIDLFDALYGETGIRLILPRHEQGLVHAADGYARSTGRPGVCLVTSGPGAANLVTGIATANYDSVPLVCFTGPVPTSLIGNDAFQEVDITGITRSICKYSVTVRTRERLGEIIKKAFHIATTGRPGPVLVDLPKDIQREYGSCCYPDHVNLRGYRPGFAVHGGQIKKALELLNQAKRPLFLVGGGVNIARAEEAMTRLAERTGVPVVTTIMGKGAIPSTHPLYAGSIGIHGSFAANSAVSSCDVLFSIGTRFNDRITGKNGEFAKHASIIHVDIDPASISRTIAVDIPIVADAGAAIHALLEKAVPLDTDEWRKQIDGWKENHPITMKQEGLTAESVIRCINRLEGPLLVATDVGQNQLWAAQFLELDKDRRLLTSGGLGTMGYGLPAALGAKIGNPDKTVILITGDGGLQMNMQELATAVVCGLPVIICVLNNGWLGNVRQWQEMFFEHRYSATCLRRRYSCPAVCMEPGPDCPPYTPDFIKLAESFGITGIRVTKAEEIQPALQAAEASKDAPVLIEFLIAWDDNVLPIVPPGSPIDHMILENERGR